MLGDHFKFSCMLCLFLPYKQTSFVQIATASEWDTLFFMLFSIVNIDDNFFSVVRNISLTAKGRYAAFASGQKLLTVRSFKSFI